MAPFNFGVTILSSQKTEIFSHLRSCLNLYRQVFIEQKLDVFLYFKGA